MGFLPIHDGFCCFAEFLVGVSDVLQHDGIWRFQKRGRAEQFLHRLLVPALVEIDPAEGVDISSIVRVEFQGAGDELLGVVQIFTPLGPHVGEEIVGLWIFGIEADGCFHQLGCFYEVSSAFGGGSVAQEEGRIQHLGIRVRSFNKSALEGHECGGVLVRLTQ